MQAASLVLTSYQDSLRQAMDVVANNVANASTSGFKREALGFDTLIKRPTPKEAIQFVINRGSFRDTAQGPMVTTGNPLDVAIQGQGYFPIQTKDGTRYTRGGSFQLNGAGEIVTVAGDKLLAEGDQPITVPEDATDLHIAGDGVITAKSGTGTAVVQLGKLKTVKFAKEQELQRAGDNLYSTNQAPEPDTDSRLVQGMVESSNVRAVSEITNMIQILRSYQNAVHLADQENQRLTNALNKLSRATA